MIAVKPREPACVRTEETAMSNFQPEPIAPFAHQTEEARLGGKQHIVRVARKQRAWTERVFVQRVNQCPICRSAPHAAWCQTALLARAGSSTWRSPQSSHTRA